MLLSSIHTITYSPDNKINGSTDLGKLQGIFEDPYFRYVQVEMIKCVGTSPSGLPCENSTVIDNVCFIKANNYNSPMPKNFL